MEGSTIDAQKLLYDIGASTVRILLSLVRAIILIPVITKLLGVNSYGIWAATLAVVNIAVSIGSLHMKGSLIRYSSSDDETRQVFADVLLLSTLSGSLFGIAILILSDATNLWDALRGPGLGLAAALVIFTTIISRVVLNYPRAKSNVKLYELFKTIHLFGETAVIVGVIYVTKSIVAGFVAMGIGTFLISGFILVRYVKLSDLRPDISNFRKYFRYSLPMVPKSMSTILLTNIDKYLVLLFLTATDAGIYAVTYSLALLLNTFTSVLNPTLYPTVTSAWDKGEQESLRKLYDSIFHWYSLVAIPAVVGLAVLAHPLLRLISTPLVAREGAHLVPLIALGFFLRGYDNPVAYIINAAEENTVLAKILLLGAAINVVLNLVLIPRLELMGAVIATIVAQSGIAVSIIYYGKKKIDFRIPAGTILRTVLISAVMGGTLLAIPISLNWYIKLVVYPVLGIILFAGGATLLGLVSINDIKQGQELL